MALPGDRSEIAFFDVETTVPTRPGQGFSILEFGAILVCPKKLDELHSYSTLVRPADPSLISSLSVRCNGITPDAVVSAPTFAEIADTVFDILHGRIWAGHNIVRFDCARIREAFAEVGRAPPEPKGTIDSLALLTQRFGRRAGDMKMATLATYFGLGQQTHRSLDDVRMNLEVLKHCATVLFLESSLPDIFTVNRSLLTHRRGEEVSDSAVANQEGTGSFVMDQLSNQMEIESTQPDVTTEEKTELMSPEMNSAAAISEGSSGHNAFIEPDKVSTPNVSACFGLGFHGSQSQRIKILHRDVILHLYCARLRIRFGISRRFVGHAGRPRLSFVVDVSPILCEVLDACDSAARKLSMDSGSNSEWQPVVTRKYNHPTARLRIPTTVSGDVTQSDTEICQKEPSGTVQKFAFVKFDAAELDSLFKPGTFVDTFLSFDQYDYQQTAGIRLVAKKLIILFE
ncbi:protein NEN1-like [Pistacia vera]|uniref:protein NEN1-like n=1 Tax=Pistacia vera TaxID=55513 RepID=UPI001262EFCA|nr:protein NEN1-like [Pistacia vera]